MGSDGRLWAALAKVLAQKKEHPGRTAMADSAREPEGEEIGKGQARRQTAKAN